MRFALSTGFLNPRSLEEVIDVCGQSDTREIEAWGQDGLFTELVDIPSAQRRLSARGIKVVSVHSPFKNDGVLRSVETDAYLKRFEGTCRIAVQLEAELIVAHPLVVDDERSVERETPADEMPGSFGLWRRLGEIAQNHGLQLAFENLPHSKVWPSGCGLGFVQAIVQILAMDHVGVCLDLSHSFANQEDPVAFLNTAGKAPLLIHTSDGIAEHDRHLPLGEGDQDWDRLLAQLSEQSYGGPLVLEVRSPYLDGRLVAAMYAYLRSRLGRTENKTAEHAPDSNAAHRFQ